MFSSSTSYLFGCAIKKLCSAPRLWKEFFHLDNDSRETAFPEPAKVKLKKNCCCCCGIQSSPLLSTQRKWLPSSRWAITIPASPCNSTMADKITHGQMQFHYVTVYFWQCLEKNCIPRFAEKIEKNFLFFIYAATLLLYTLHVTDSIILGIKIISSIH